MELKDFVPILDVVSNLTFTARTANGGMIMRLIDADALKEEVEFQQEHMWPEDLSRRIPGMIDNASTIDAIPVEWLRKVRNDDKLTLDDVETIDLLLAWWQKE